MGDAAGTFLKSLQAIASEALATGAGHLEPEELLAYSAGELPEEKLSRIQAHLAICADCTEAVLDLSAFPDVELQSESLRRSQDEETEDWQAIREKIASEGTYSEVPGSMIRRNPQISWVHALAASLMVAVFGLFLLVVDLELRMKGLSNLQSNLYIKDVLPETASNSRDSSAGNKVSVPAGLDHAVLVLALTDFEPYPDYEARILDAAGNLLWKRTDMIRMPDGSFTLQVERNIFPSGSYQIQLYGLKSGQEKLIVTYPVWITYTAP